MTVFYQPMNKNTHTQTVGRPTFLGCQNLWLPNDICGTIACRPWVTPPCLQAALILTVLLFVPSGSSISQDDLVSSRSTSGGVLNLIFGNPRSLLRIGIVGVIVISSVESAQASTVTTVGWNWNGNKTKFKKLNLSLRPTFKGGVGEKGSASDKGFRLWKVGGL